MKKTTDFIKMKQEKEPIVMVTAYDYPSGKLVEQAGVDTILVGDSLGMVVLGYESTIPVTVDEMIHHTKAVRRGAKDTFIVTDMPFMSYHISVADALSNAQRMMQEGLTNAVKVEGANQVLQVISTLTEAGVPVIAHLGLTPQSVEVLGGYKIQGKDAKAAQRLIEDALLCEEAGAFALVLECVPKELAAEISKRLSIPTIGIGAGNGTDGQVLVYHDLIGYGVERVPTFVKQYEQIDNLIIEAIAGYAREVRAGTFPQQGHTFSMNVDELKAVYGGKAK